MPGESRSANTDGHAVAWASKLKDGSLTATDANALDEWLAGRPHRLAALARAQSMQPSVAQTTTAVDVTERAVTRRRFLSMSLAAGLGIASVSGSLLYLSGGRRYSTDIGEMGHVLLPDGSMAILNTATEIESAFTRSDRRVRLLRGEALFDVGQDLMRPFSLEASGRLIRTHGAIPAEVILKGYARLGALIDYGRDIARPLTARPSRAGFEARGTTFVVRIKSGDRVEAAIVQGTVEICRRAPKQFEMVVVTDHTVLSAQQGATREIRPIETLSLEAKLAWLSRRIEFSGGDTLADAAREFNRYNRLKIVLSGRLGLRAIRGSFDLDRPRDFVASVERVTSATVQFVDQLVIVTE